jgi:hypothetical protein
MSQVDTVMPLLAYRFKHPTTKIRKSTIYIYLLVFCKNPEILITLKAIMGDFGLQSLR